MRTVLCVILSQMLTTFVCPAFRSVEEPNRAANQASLSPAQQGARQWRAGTYRGLTMGKSTRADMLRVLGKPIETKSYRDGRDSGKLYGYEATDIPGELVVTVDNRRGIVRNVEINPRNLSQEAAIKHFGEGYEITRYDFDVCLGDGESAPLYESPKGNLTFIEYRARGIALLPNEEGRINEIKYVSEPIGAPSSKCKRKSG